MATEAAHDPIAIAALIAELPELEAKYAEAKEAAEQANKALDTIQDRIDMAIAVLKRKAPKGSKWGNHEIGASALQQLQQHVGRMQQQVMVNGDANAAQNIQEYLRQMSQKEQMAKMAPPPLIKKGGPW